MRGRREYGDYQTPPDFSRRVCLYLSSCRHIRPSAVVEPTCGTGSFLRSSLLFDADEYYGIDINPDYCKICRDTIRDERVTIVNADFFSFSSKALIRDKSHILVVGNPPWATNSALSSLHSDNLPPKANFRGLKGLDAITGESNFDICEYMILHVIDEYRDSETAVAMLCKTSVARKVFAEMKRRNIFFKQFDILEFNASSVFGVSVSACLMFIQLTKEVSSPCVCNVYDFERAEVVKSQLRISNGCLCNNLLPSAKDLDGRCCFEWRQGLKHDCAKVMELTLKNGTLQNGAQERVEIETDCVYPLVKSSMFKSPVIHDFSKFVIVTQRKAREETEHLACDAPKTWEYLNRHMDSFQSRKSSIYHGAPLFSMFGIGDYSYSKFKVGISGFYKEPLFSVLYSDDYKPVMTDDTTYFIGFDSFDMAYTAMLLLNSERVREFIKGIAFPDAKRPYTKKLLARIDLKKASELVSVHELMDTESHFHLPAHITDRIYRAFKTLPEVGQISL